MVRAVRVISRRRSPVQPSLLPEEFEVAEKALRRNNNGWDNSVK